jgi:ABC-type lipoprotein export system ATPase subunit
MLIPTNEDIAGRYSATHLICDGSYPLITNSFLDEEAMLYHLDSDAIASLCGQFLTITGKALSLSSDISALSGGQKVILMALLALHSPALSLLFVNLTADLDKERSEAMLALIDKYRAQKTEILLV